MSDDSFEQFAASKTAAADIVERFRDRYDPDVLKTYAEFSVGFAAIMGATTDSSLMNIIGNSANMAGMETGQDWREIVGKFTGDEELTAAILEAQMSIRGEQ